MNEEQKRLERISAEMFGASLRGVGFNILVTDVPGRVTFLEQIFGMKGHQVSQDFAILTYHGQVMQLHADHTYGSHPLLALLPENPPRGAGIEIRLYHSDPDDVARIAEDLGATILQAPADKPHGLREVYILCPDGYAWVASKPLLISNGED